MDSKDATTSLSEDLKELTFERPVPNSLKSLEELEQLTVDEKLSDIERAVYLLSSGQEVQRISVINNLPDLLRDCHADCMRRVVPKVREVLHVAQDDMQLAASLIFIEILRNDLVPIQNYASTFLQTILSSVDNKDPEIANAWLDTLLDVIDLLPKDIIKKQILTIAIEKGQLSQPVHTRLSCCKILGKISTRFEPFIIKKEILPIVQSLCQDVEYEVRGCMCLQLDSVARGLGLEATKSAILPELVELTNDEEDYVRIAGLQTVVNILSLLDEETCKSTLIPLVCKYCQQSIKNQDVTLPVLAKEYGRLCHFFNRYLTDEQKMWFVDYFKHMCKVGLVENKTNHKYKDSDKDCPSKEQQVPFNQDIYELDNTLVQTRKNCAFNFPAMAMFVGTKLFKSELGTCFSSLCKDPYVSVRKSISSGFHEVARFMGTCVSNLQGDLIVLLMDENIEVLNGLVTHLPETLNAICGPLTSQAMHEAKQNHVADIIPAILSAEAVMAVSNDWRLQEIIIKHFKSFQYLTNSDVIYQKIIPVLFTKLRRARTLPVRLAAAHSTLFLLRNLKKAEQRAKLLETLVSDFCHGNSCQCRSLFIDICKVTMEYYSKAFFKEWFFKPLLSLHQDPVPNIRYRLCSVLPDLKRVIKLPNDKTLLQQLDTCVQRLLIGEKDKDVSMAVKVAIEEMDKIPVQMESLACHLLMEEDNEDQKREVEEKKLIEMEEKKNKEDEEAAKLKEKKGIKDIASRVPKKGKASKLEVIPGGIKQMTPTSGSSSFGSAISVKDSSSCKPMTKSSKSVVSVVSTPGSARLRKSSLPKMMTDQDISSLSVRQRSFSISSTIADKPIKKNTNSTDSATKIKKSK